MSANNTNAYAAGTAAPAHTHTEAGAGGQGVQSVGDKIKGGWNVFHGAGEAIRGNTNNFLDNVGEQIAGRGSNTGTTTNTTAAPASTTAPAAGTTAGHPQTRTEGGQRPAAVAASGADEISAGMHNLRN